MTPGDRRRQLPTKVLMSACILAAASPGRAEAPVRVASIFAHTGVAAPDDQASITGAREAAQDLNAKGGVLGRRIELVELDNLSTPIGSKLAAQAAVKQGVCAILGGNWSAHSLAMAPVAQEARVPMLATLSTHEDVTRAGDFVFRVCFTNAFQGTVMAHFARTVLHARTAVTAVDLTSEYALSLARTFQEHFLQDGGTVLRQLEYRVNQGDFRELAAGIRDAAPDVVFIPGYWESGAIIKAYQDLGGTAIPLGGDGWGTGRFFERGGAECPRGYYCAHWSEVSDSPSVRAFVARHGGGQRPVTSAEVFAYDGLCLLADALRRARATDPAKLRAALAATRSFTGVAGGLSYQNGRDPSRSATILVIENGRVRFFQTVKP
jgi:branched-chain amino acid transport system substrate-binding protein